MKLQSKYVPQTIQRVAVEVVNEKEKRSHPPSMMLPSRQFPGLLIDFWNGLFSFIVPFGRITPSLISFRGVTLIVDSSSDTTLVDVKLARIRTGRGRPSCHEAHPTRPRNPAAGIKDRDTGVMRALTFPTICHD
jgi:hypothetical protein